MVEIVKVDSQTRGSFACLSDYGRLLNLEPVLTEVPWRPDPTEERPEEGMYILRSLPNDQLLPASFIPKSHESLFGTFAAVANPGNADSAI